MMRVSSAAKGKAETRETYIPNIFDRLRPFIRMQSAQDEDHDGYVDGSWLDR